MRGIGDFLKELRRRRVLRTAALYVVGVWAVMQVADVAFPGLGIPESAIRYVLIGAILGFPIAVVFGWLYQITPQGIVRTAPVDPDELQDISLHISDYVILAALVVVAATITFGLVEGIRQTEDEQPLAPVKEAPEHSIAVLPFVNMSDDAANEYFSDGIAEELLNELANVSGLHVAARTSSFYFKGRNEDISSIAAQLGVRTVLEGSVRKAGNTVRITAQLIDAEGGYHLWSQKYDRELNDVFAIQEEIAGAVVSALKVKLLNQEQQRLAQQATDNFDAFEAYLLGRQQMAKRTSTSLREAVRHFERAIELDPDYALAYVGLADSYNLLSRWGGVSAEERTGKVEPALQRALQLDPELAEAHASLGAAHAIDFDLEAAQAAYEMAIALNPNYAPTYLWYGVLLKWGLGQREQALEMHRRALELDPLSTITNIALAEDYLELGRFEDARSQVMRVIEIDPDFPRAYAIMADLHWEVFMQLDQAVVWFDKAVELDPGNPNNPRWLGMLHLDLGDFAQGEHWIRESVSLAPTQARSGSGLIYLHLNKKDYEAAYDAARAVLEKNPLDRQALAVVRDHDLAAGAVEQARQRYETVHPELAADSPQVGPTNYGKAVDYALVLMEMGDSERADALLRAVLEQVADMPRLGYAGYGIVDAEAYAVMGETDRALDALQSAIDTGWRIGWRIQADWNRNLAGIRDHPRFIAMMEGLERQMTAQRAALVEH